MSKRKKKFPIKYMRKGLFANEDFLDGESDKKEKGRRRIRKPKMSVHMKTGRGRGKAK